MVKWDVCSFPQLHNLPTPSSVFPMSKGFSHAVSLLGAFFHAIPYTVPSHANLSTSYSKKPSQPCTCKITSCSLLSLLFLQKRWIKMEFYHREATRSCSCWYTLVQKVYQGEAPQRHWGESSSSTSSAEKIPGSVVQTKSDEVAAFLNLLKNKR